MTHAAAALAVAGLLAACSGVGATSAGEPDPCEVTFTGLETEETVAGPALSGTVRLVDPVGPGEDFEVQAFDGALSAGWVGSGDLDGCTSVDYEIRQLAPATYTVKAERESDEREAATFYDGKGPSSAAVGIGTARSVQYEGEPVEGLDFRGP